MPDRLDSPGTLHSDEFLLSPNGHYLFIMQGDGNLVLYPQPSAIGGTALWNSGTFGSTSSDNRMILGTDGNLLITQGGAKVWESGSGLDDSDVQEYFLQAQDDNNVVVYQNTSPPLAIWAWRYGPLP